MSPQYGATWKHADTNSIPAPGWQRLSYIAWHLPTDTIHDRQIDTINGEAELNKLFANWNAANPEKWHYYTT